METYAPFGDIVVVVHDVSGQSEVTDLHYLALREEDIPGSEVPMHTLKKVSKCDKQLIASYTSVFNPQFHPFPNRHTSLPQLSTASISVCISFQPSSFLMLFHIAL